MSTSDSLPKASSTFWLIDTTSVSDTFTTTAIFTLWVPLYTTSTTPTPTPSAIATAGRNTSTRSQPGIIAGSVVGCALLAALVVSFCFICRTRRARPQFKLQTDSSKAPDANQSGNSAHALLDLAAGLDPHPSNIEPWVAPTAVQQTGKFRPGADPTEQETREQERAEPPPPVVGPPRVVEPGHHESELPSPRLAGRTLQLVQHENVTSSSNASTPYNPKSNTPAPQTRRRRNQRGPSPPRLEEDAGVSLMRAGDNAAPTPADEPPAYNFAPGSALRSQQL